MDSSLPLAVVFDMDGLLIDSEPYWQAAEGDVFGHLGVELPDDLTALTQCMTTQAVTAFWYKRSPWTGVSLHEAEQRVLEQVAQDVTQHGRLKPGVERLLSELGDLRVPVGLASNSPRMIIDRVIEGFDLVQTFDVVLSAEHVAHGKPAPDIYLHAARHLGFDPRTCVALEDSVTGATAAKAAGYTVYLVPDNEHLDPRHAEFHGVFSSLENVVFTDLEVRQAISN